MSNFLTKDPDLTYSAKVICDSISPQQSRLTTFEIVFPRYILAEFNTHCMFERNSASSRAIPYAKRREQVATNPAAPPEWGKNQKGMQASELLDEESIVRCEAAWISASIHALECADNIATHNAHKQVVNRLLEPFVWHKLTFTATDDPRSMPNFLAQRDHPDADPAMQRLASKIRKAYEESTPTPLDYGDWHLPYVLDRERLQYKLDILKQISVARCARTSYYSFDDMQKQLIEADLNLYDKLLTADPAHASPFGHVATPFEEKILHMDGELYHRARMGKFYGWAQFRHLVFGDYRKELDWMLDRGMKATLVEAAAVQP